MVSLKSVYWNPTTQQEVRKEDLVYREVECNSIYVAFPLLKCDREGHVLVREDTGDYVVTNVYLLIWTTTPWSITENEAVALSKNIEYKRVLCTNNCIYIVEESFDDAFFGDDLVSSTPLVCRDKFFAANPYYLSVDLESKQQIVWSDMVKSNFGTGLVHVAPSLGGMDLDIGVANDLWIIRSITYYGTYQDNIIAPDGMSIWDSEDLFISYLRDKGYLIKVEPYKHFVPFDSNGDKVYSIVKEEEGLL